METIGLIIGAIIALISWGAINVIRNYISKVKEHKEWKEAKELAEKDGVITKDEKEIIDKEYKESEEAKRKFFKSVLNLLSMALKSKINKKAKPSDLIDIIKNKI